MGTSQSCPRVNTTIPENGAQWSLSNGNWGNVKLGWLIAGLSTLITTVICMYATYRHARHYHRPKEQRQIIRILWMPLVFSIICFFAYRYYRYYIYYKLIFIVYESFCLMAFLALMLAYVGSSTEEQMQIMQSKDKRPLPWPFGCIRYRPSKPYFLYALNGSVVQYAFVRPLISIIAMICESFDVLCAHKFSLYFAHLYLEVVDFTSISIALYGLVVLYTLVKERLQGKRPMTKFVVIKLVVAVTYYQAFLFSALVSQGLIKANAYWSKSNISDGLNAIVICVEMVIVSCVMYWAYPANEYIAITKEEEISPTNPWRAFGQALNFWDFVMEAWRGLQYFRTWRQNKGSGNSSDERTGAEYNQNEDRDTNLDINAAFNAPHPQSTTSSKFDMSELQNRRSMSLAYRQCINSPRMGSYLEMDDDEPSKRDLETARQKSTIFAKSPAILPMSPSSYRPSSTYRDPHIRSPTARTSTSTPSSACGAPSSEGRDPSVEGSKPVYESLMAPRDLAAMRRSLRRQSLPVIQESISTVGSSMDGQPGPRSGHQASSGIAPEKGTPPAPVDKGCNATGSVPAAPEAQAGDHAAESVTPEQKRGPSCTSTTTAVDMNGNGKKVVKLRPTSARVDTFEQNDSTDGPDTVCSPVSQSDQRSTDSSIEGDTDIASFYAAPEQIDLASDKSGMLRTLTLPETGQFSPFRI